MITADQSLVRAPAVYEGRARHRRFVPEAREFSPRLFLAYLDVDALPHSLDALPGWSARHRAPIRFRRRDFFDGADTALGDAVRDLVEKRIGRRPSGRICLLAHLRTFGWQFNPLAVYYCWKADASALDAVVLEVTNTPWGERTWYVFDALEDPNAPAGAKKRTVQKEMYVSPFLPMDMQYDVSWTTPGQSLGLDIRVSRAGETIFAAGLALRRRALDRRRAVTMPLRYPLMPLRGSIEIYRRALGLLAARIPLYRHASRPMQEVGL